METKLEEADSPSAGLALERPLRISARARDAAPTKDGVWCKAMSQGALQRLRRQLEERERELRTKIIDERNRVREESIDHFEEVGDLVDRAFVTTQVSMERDLIERCMTQLEEIARTHDRIATGDIGICIDCGDAIEVERLRANPVACRCTECQIVREKVDRINSR
jgi:DnaK suppressor protein